MNLLLLLLPSKQKLRILYSLSGPQVSKYFQIVLQIFERQFVESNKQWNKTGITSSNLKRRNNNFIQYVVLFSLTNYLSSLRMRTWKYKPETQGKILIFCFGSGRRRNNGFPIPIPLSIEPVESNTPKFMILYPCRWKTWATLLFLLAIKTG